MHDRCITFNGALQAAKLEAKKATKAIKACRASCQPGGGPKGETTRRTDRRTSFMRQSQKRTTSRPTVNSGGSLTQRETSIVKSSPPGPWVILPESPARALWAGLVLLALSYDAMALPFKLVFIGDEVDGALTVLDVMCDLLLIGDLLLRFRLAFSFDGRLIISRGEIRRCVTLPLHYRCMTVT